MIQQIENLNYKSRYSTTSSESSSLQETKDLVVSIDSSTFNNKTNRMFPSQTITSNATAKIRDFKNSDSFIVCDNLTKKRIQRNQRMFSCLLVQQYFVYFIMSAFILLCSFGFYYVLVTTNLRIESLENSLMNKIESKTPIRFISSKDYFADSEDEGLFVNIIIFVIFLY